ncbi:TraR/DksA C4-type zinc finger protein [Yersinia pseudotuberculosis]|uniref:TraR/DksA C4-type zinc finger protein n=1 Tax=Yersinia pseudotuberculosis TaxID=633 RepID=UPI002B2B593D|nr:hypothetical protein YPSE1_44700 [Yersinia pseudotuberculosis]
MPDIADVAQEYTDIQLHHALVNIRALLKTPSLSICQHCNAPIPPARQALGGVTTCVTCQEKLEFTHRIVIAISYPLALLLLLGILSLIPQLYDLPLNEKSVYWRDWRIVALASIIPVGLYFVGLLIVRTWDERIIYCLCNSFALYLVYIAFFIWILIKSFVLLEWQIPLYDELGLSLAIGVVISCIVLLLSFKIIKD